METQALAGSRQTGESEKDQEMGTEGPLPLVCQYRQALIKWKLYTVLQFRSNRRRSRCLCRSHFEW